MTNQKVHGGKRKGAGRPRSEKTKPAPVHLGLIDARDREIIMKGLTPFERGEILLAAALMRIDHDNLHAILKKYVDPTAENESSPIYNAIQKNVDSSGK